MTSRGNMTTIFYNHKIWNEQLGSGAPNKGLLFVSFWNSHEFQVSSTLFPTCFPSFFRCQALLASLLCCPSAAPRLLPGPLAPRDVRRRQRRRRRPARCTGGPCSWRCRKWKARWRRPIYHKRNLDWNDHGSIPIDTFLVGWTSIYQLFWGSLGTRVLTHPQMIECDLNGILMGGFE